MRIPLPEVLDLPSFRAADLQILAGDAEAAWVRWVHSSEVYEMGGLLAGGEILLTTGLGLHGCDDRQLERYVEQLAASGCTALGLELGRSFLEPPAAMIAAAQSHGVVLFVLTALVPFERMAEDFCELVIARRLGDAADAQGWAELLDLVVAGSGTRSLLDQVARIAGCAVELLDAEGHVVERSRIRTVGHEGVDGLTAAIRGRTGIHGHVRLCGRPGERRRRLAERAAIALALELARDRDPGWRPTPGQALISDLFAGDLPSGAATLRRLREAGLTRTRSVSYLAVALDGVTAPGGLLAAVESHWPAVTGPVVAGTVGRHVVVVMALPSAWRPDRVRETLQAAAELVHEAAGRGDRLRVGAAAPCEDAAGLTAAVRQAREIVRLAEQERPGSRVLLARDVGVQRLVGAAPAEHVAAFVGEQIGPLIEHDRTRRTQLLRTVDAYLATGCSKAATAKMLGLGRQALYDRLARIERLLGVSTADAQQMVGVHLAVLAWRQRTGLDPQVGFAPSALSE